MLPTLLSRRMEAALRRAALAHRGQSRKGSDLPYLVHPLAVAMVLDRLGFSEDVVIAGLLHDAVEDSDLGLDEIRSEFGADVSLWVGFCSEAKKDAFGADRPWIDRKSDYLRTLRSAPTQARAVALADKLHNLASIRHDLRAGVEVWSLFNASREDVLWYYRAALDVAGNDDPRLGRLAVECSEILAEIVSNQ